MKKTCCVFMIYGMYKEKYHFFNHNSVESFKKWHPDVDVFIVEDEYPDEPYGVKCMKTWKKYFGSYDRLIALDADTITCSRFDEFLNDEDTPILATLDFPMNPSGYTKKDLKIYQLPHNNIECLNVNGGIICFNSISTLDIMMNIYYQDPDIKHEQAVLQHMIYTHPSLIRVVDFPYLFSPFVYNVRGHGTIGTDCITSDCKLRFGFDGPIISEIAPTKLYRPVGDKLYNHLGKHVKCFHFATRDPNIKNWFSEETVQFFVNHCNCDWTLENNI